MKDATFRFTEAFLHEDRWTKLMSLDLACWQLCESSAPSSSSLFPQCLVCVFLLVSWIIQMEKGKRSYITHTLVWMCSFAFAKSAWGQGEAAHSGTGEALVLPNFFFLPLYRGPDWSRLRTRSEALWDFLCHLVEFHRKQIIWGLSYQAAGYTPEPFSCCSVFLT